MFDLIIFDCDGVLVDSEAIANHILAAHVKALGMEISLPQVISDFVGLSMASVVEKLELKLGRPLPGDWLERVQDDTFAAFRRELKAVAGVSQLVADLSQRAQKFCVASSGGFDKITLSLTLTGLYPAFEGRIFSAAQVAQGKPAPDLFLLAAATCHAKPGRTLVIEDSLPGVAAARRAGMTVYGYAARGQAAELQAAGARPFTSMQEIALALSIETGSIQTESIQTGATQTD